MQASKLGTALLTGGMCFALTGCSIFGDRSSSVTEDRPMQEGTSQASPATRQPPNGNVGLSEPTPLSRTGSPGSGFSGDTDPALPQR